MKATGLEIDGEIINLATIGKKRDLIDVQTIHLDFHKKERNVKQLYIFLKSSSILTTGIDSDGLVIKEVFLKTKSKTALKKALPFQKEVVTSINPEKSVIFPFTSKINNSGFKITFFITTKETLQSHLKHLNAFHIDPDIVSSTSMALARYAKYATKGNYEGFILQIGYVKSCAIFLQEGIPKRSYSFNQGIDKLLKALQQDTSFDSKKKDDLIKLAQKLNINKLDHNKYTHLMEAAEKFKVQTKKTLLSLKQKEKPQQYPILITGQVTAFLDIDKFLISTSQEIISTIIESRLKKYAVCLGLALDALQTNKTIQFRQDDFTPKKTLRKAAFLTTFFIFFSLILISFTYFVGNYFLKQHKISLQRKFHKLQVFEKEMMGKEEIIPYHNVKKNIEHMETVIYQEVKDFPYYLLAPKVSDVLEWTANHPLLSKNKDDIEIKNINYRLQSFPKIGFLKDPYLAKVEIEFTTKNRELAKKFHEELLKGDAFVNEKEKISWDSMEDEYKTSFYLKQKNKELIYEYWKKVGKDR